MVCVGAVFFNPLRGQTTVPVYYFTTLAGAASAGSADGPGDVARFNRPFSLAIDATGNLFVGDSRSFTVRKITPAGLVSTVAGRAGDARRIDGPAAAARFSNIQGIAVDRLGGVYVAEFNSIRRIAADGAVTTLAGSAGGNFPAPPSHDGVGAGASFNGVNGLAIDSAGTLLASEPFKIRRVTSDATVTTVAGSDSPGEADGSGGAAGFFGAAGLAVDAGGSVYVVDSSNSTLRKIVSGNVVTTLAGRPGIYGAADGIGAAAAFYIPSGVAVDPAGRIYVADQDNQTVRMVTPSGQVTTLAGRPSASPGQLGVAGFADGSGAAALFNYPTGAALDGAGNLYIADSGNNLIRKVTAAGVVTTVAGLAPSQSYGAVDATGAAARFDEPLGMAVTPAGVCYVADSGNHVIRKISPAGVVSTFAGQAGQSGYIDGTGTEARFDWPTDLAVDSAGNVYVLDSSRTVRKITPAGVVTTLAGAGNVPGSQADGQGTAAVFAHLNGLAVAPNGDVYVSEIISGSSLDQSRLRKITPAGTVTTETLLNGVFHPHTVLAGLAFDAAGTLYACDPTYRLLYIASASGVKTIVFNNLANPYTFTAAHVAVDAAGRVFLTERDFGNRVALLTADGQFEIIGGLGYQDGHQDGLGADALFGGTAGIAVDAAGTIYVACADNTIRKGLSAAAPTIMTQPQNQTASAGASVQFSVVVAGVPAPTYQWYLGANPISGAVAANYSFTSAKATDAGDYTVVVTNALGSATSSKATLTVAAAANPPATGGGGGAGGGAAGPGFGAALFLLGAIRRALGTGRARAA